MIIRELKEDDIPRVNEIHEKYHKDTAYFPHLATILAHGVVEESGTILGYGALAISGEAVLMLDLGLSGAMKRGRVVKLFMENMKRAALGKRLDKVFIISESDRLIDHIRDIYGAKEMRALILEIDNG